MKQAKKKFRSKTNSVSISSTSRDKNVKKNELRMKSSEKRLDDLKQIIDECAEAEETG